MPSYQDVRFDDGTENIFFDLLNIVEQESLCKVFPHEWIPNGDFLYRVEVLSPGSKETNSWQRVCLLDVI